ALDLWPASIHISAPLRPLRSFPTRRSSDLSLAPHASRLLRVVPAAGFHYTGMYYTVANANGAFDVTSSADGSAEDVTSNAPLALDRKSTRLNSSHDQISYAVFCLKKKNSL